MHIITKHTFHIIFAFICTVILLYLISIQSAPAEESDEYACSVEMIKNEFKNVAPNVIDEDVRIIQNTLKYNGYMKEDGDGYFGKRTRRALLMFCNDLRNMGVDDIDGNIREYVKYSRSLSDPELHPDWINIVNSNKFREWDNNNPEGMKFIDFLESINIKESIKLLSRFKTLHTRTQSEKGIINTAASGPQYYYNWDRTVQPDEQVAKPKGVTNDVDAFELVCSDVISEDNELIIANKSISYPNQKLFDKALDKLFMDLNLSNSPDITSAQIKNCKSIMQSAARNGPVDVSVLPQIKASPCGCSGSFSGTVTGIFPLWLAESQQVLIDFSSLDRIGLYAYKLDDTGELTSYPENIDDYSDTIISKSHKYYVDVDGLIYISKWQKWDKCTLKAAANNLAWMFTRGSRELKYEAQLDDDCNGLINLSEGNNADSETSDEKTLDGLILYFDGYSEEKHAAIINEFIDHISNTITINESWVNKVTNTSKTRGYSLSLMLGLGSANYTDKKTVDLFKMLADVLLCNNEQCDTGCSSIDNLYINIEEPTSTSKKKLRIRVEEAFHGDNRRTVLRKIIPVIGLPSNHKYQVSDSDLACQKTGAFDQFEDDLIYFQDNFSGVGFWSTPAVHESFDSKGKTILQEKLNRIFKVADSTNRLGEFANKYLPEMCNYACPNRWIFRYAFDMLSGILIVYAVLALWICPLRKVYTQHKPKFIMLFMLTILIFTVSLTCDPYWTDKADVIAIVIIVTSIIAVLWRIYIKAIRPPLP